MTYEIRNVDELENSAANLATYNQKITNNASSIKWVLGQIQENWENEAAADLASIIEGLTECINNLNNTISPTIAKYVTTMNTLVAETRRNQSQSA